ncbi:MAG: hypothetical protein WDO12_12585 [Pseudomonadota bacterium]
MALVDRARRAGGAIHPAGAAATVFGAAVVAEQVVQHLLLAAASLSLLLAVMPVSMWLELFAGSGRTAFACPAGGDGDHPGGAARGGPVAERRHPHPSAWCA